MTLYHYTDTARLPWILSSGVLRPSENRIGGMQQDVLWATSNPAGDRSASIDRGGDWRGGDLLHVRFALDEADFQPWSEARGTLGWPATDVSRLETTKGAEPAAWWIRREPLMIDGTVIEIRSYADNRWRAVDLEAPMDAGRGAMLIQIGRRAFGSIREAGYAGGSAYTVVSTS